MGNLEQIPMGEIHHPMETEMPPEVLEMNKNLVNKAEIIFKNNHELVKEAMFGLGDRKAKEVLKNLAECREQTKEAVRKFRTEKEKMYPIS